MHSRRPPIVYDVLNPLDIYVDSDGSPRIQGLGCGKIASCSPAITLLEHISAWTPNDHTPSTAGDAYSLARVIFFVS